MTPLSRRKDREASELWAELVSTVADINEIAKESRRVTELLPWWAAPGRRALRPDGTLFGDVVWSPAIQPKNLPDTGFLILRVFEWDIERLAQDMPAKERGAFVRNAKRALQTRIEARQAELKKVGLDKVCRRQHKLEMRGYDIRDRLEELADQGSFAGIAALILWEFSRACLLPCNGVEGCQTMSLKDISKAWLAMLQVALPACDDLLREHVATLVDHPNQWRKSFTVLDRSEDAWGGFILVDRDRLPDDVLTSMADNPAQAAA